jgi:hypothetical protein
MRKIIIAIHVFAACIIITSCKKESAEEIKIPPVIVSDANMNGWVKNPAGLATVKFVTPPSTPPLGSGSLQLSTPDRSFGRLRDTTHSGTRLSDLTELSYSTYIEQRDSTVDEIFVVLLIDINGDGKTDNNLVFDPRYQNQTFITGVMLNQGFTKINTWQKWDALHGGWFIGPVIADDPDHGGWYFDLATYIAKYPNATILNDPAKGGGSIRVSVGGPVFSKNFIGYADNFKIGVKGITTTYDFE